MTKIGTWTLPLCTAIVWPTIPGKIVEARAQVRMTRRSFVRFRILDLLAQLASMYGPFFDDLAPCLNLLRYFRFVERRRTIMGSVRLLLRVLA